MNRIYKVIWSRVKNCYVVVSEIANNRGKINGSTGTGVSTLLCALALVGSVAPPLNVAQAVNPAGTGAGVAWGNGAYSGTDQHNVALGGYAQASGTVALSLGAHSESTGAYSTAVGGGSHATAKNAAAIGPWSEARAENAVAVGATAKSLAEYAMAVGGDSMANAKNAVALGAIANASQENAVAIGSKAESSGEYAAAIGGGAKAKNKHAIAVGSLSEATGEGSFAVGNNSKAWNNYAYAIGGSSKATGQWSIAMGTNATAQEDSTVAIGTWAEATKGQATAIGNQARARAIGATSLGRLSLVSAVDGTAIGSSTSVTGLNGTAIGNKANVSVKNGVAIGNEANVANENAVAIGAGSETAAAVGTASEMINGEVHNFAGANPGSTVSVGKAGAERTITNVAAGRLSATSTDAVNGSQLYAVNTEVNKGVVYAGDVKAAGANDNKFTQRLGAQTNVVGGVADVSKLSDNNIGVVSNGSNTLNVKLAKELQGLTSVTTGNTVMNTDGVTITGGPKIVKDGIDAGNKQITNVASGGDVITNGANIGDINRIVTAKDKYITGGTATYQANGDGTANLTGTNGLTANVTGLKNNFVTSGSVSNDGKTLTLERNDTGKVNVDLSNVFTEVAKGDYRLVANPEPNSQGKYKADSDGNMVLTVANDKGDQKQVTLTDIASKAQQDTNTTNITNINTTIAKGLNFKGDDATVINKQLGDQLDIKGGAAAANLSDNNIGVVSSNGSLNVKLAKDLTGLNSVTAGTARMGVDSTDHKSYVTGLDNRDWDVQNPVVVNGRAATEDQLKKVSDAITVANASKTDYRLVKNSAAADGSYTVTNNKVDLKVEDKANPTSPASTVTINNIASADDVEKLKSGFKVKAGNNEGPIKAGDTLEFAAKDNAIVEYDTAAKKLTVAVSKNPNFDSVTVGDVVINNSGINAGNKQITNVASGGDVITNGANIGDINRIVTAKDKYITGGTATYQANGDGTANLTGTNGLTANVTGLKNNFVTSGSVSNDGKTLTLERNDTGKVNVDLSNVFTEVAKGDYRLVANPEPNSQGKYKADSDGNMVLTVANDKGDQKQVTLTDIASKAQQDTNTTNITNINTTIAKGLNFAGDTGADINKQLGEKLSIKGGASADLTDNNIGVISDGAQLNVKLKKDVNLGPNGSLTINGKTYVNKDGLNAGGQKITNVAPGTDGTDAVNVDQLNAAIGGTSKATTVKAKDANVTVTEGVNAAGGKEYTVGLGDKVTLGSDADKKVVIDGTTGTITAGDKVTINGATGDIKAGTVKITGAGTVNELTNRTWDIDNPTVVHGQAATEDQLKHVSDGVKNNKTDITNINNTIAKGLNFKGDDTTVINKQLGEQLDIKGGADANKLSDDNIGVVSANGALNVKLSKELKNLTSVTTGNTVMNTDGLTINGGPKIVKDGIDAGGKKITNVAAGTDNTDAVNFGQLKDVVAAGKTILKDGKNTTVEGDGSANNPYKVNVNDDLVLGKKGADGKDGSIGVNGKDGSAVVINGKDGSIGLNGKDGANGISIKGGDGKPGVDGTNITRLVIEEKNGDKHDVATLDDGMKYGGDTGAVIKKKLNEQVNVVGGITDVNKLTTDDNIGVVSDGTNNLKARLAKDLKGLNSVTTGDTVMNSDGLTITGGPKIVKDGIDAGSKKITNVAAGTDNTDAVNFGQLKDAIAAGKTILKDGKNTTVEGDGSANNPYKVNVNDDLVLGKKGADGKDGSIGVNGKDGSAVVINGKDGSIGLNGKDGKDGLTFKGANGQDGVDGKNGTNGMTRIVYEDSNNNKHEVATTDDGLKFTGNNESVVNKNKLNSTVKVKGEGVTEEQEKTFESAAGNIAVTADGNDTLNIRLNKNIKGIDSIQTKEIHLGTPDNYTTIKKDGDRIKYGDKTFANTDDIWTIQANGTDVPANGGKVNVKGADGITVSKSANGEMTISGAGLGTMNSFNVKSTGNTTADSETAAKSITDGKTVEFSGGNNLSVKQTNTADGAKVEFALNNKIDLTDKGSVTIGDTKITDGGLVINNGPSVTKDGINAGNKQITNVDDGVNDTDAVNVRQLKAAKTNLTDGQNTKVTGDGSKNNPYKVNVEGDLNKITSITNKEGDGKLEFKGDQVVNVAGDNTIKLDGKTGDITGLTNKTLDSADFATKGRAATEEQLKLVQQEAAKKSTEKVQAKDDANNIAKVAPKAGDTFGAAGATYEVSVDKNDVKDAAREAVTVIGDKKAITVDVQPNATNHTTNYQVNFNGKEAAKQIPLTYKENGGNARTVMLSDGLDFSNGVNTTAHTDANGKVSFDVKGDLTNITSISNNSNGPKLSFGGDTVNITGGNFNMGGNKITNVQRGTNDTDAVNVKQLKDSRTTLTSDDQSVVLKKTETADGGLNYDLSVKGAVDPRVDKLTEEVGRVGAQGAALSALKPMQYDPLEPTQIMAGYGNYRGNSAIAVGVAHYKNESTMFHGGLSWAGGSSHLMANAGVTWKVGNRDAEAAVADRYRKGPISSAYAVQTEMAAMKAQNAGLKGEVSDLKYENEQIKAQNAGLQSEVEVLKAQMAAMMAKMGM